MLPPWLFSKYLNLRVSLIYPNGTFVFAVLLIRVLAKSPNLYFLKPVVSLFCCSPPMLIFEWLFTSSWNISVFIWCLGFPILQLNLISFLCCLIRSLCHDVTSRFWFHVLSTRLPFCTLLSMTYLLGFSGGMDVSGSRFYLTFFQLLALEKDD